MREDVKVIKRPQEKLQIDDILKTEFQVESRLIRQVPVYELACFEIDKQERLFLPFRNRALYRMTI